MCATHRKSRAFSNRKTQIRTGAFMPGEFEERLKSVLKELTGPDVR